MREFLRPFATGSKGSGEIFIVEIQRGPQGAIPSRKAPQIYTPKRIKEPNGPIQLERFIGISSGV
jgi:hypothetical protein